MRLRSLVNFSEHDRCHSPRRLNSVRFSAQRPYAESRLWRRFRASVVARRAVAATYKANWGGARILAGLAAIAAFHCAPLAAWTQTAPENVVASVSSVDDRAVAVVSHDGSGNATHVGQQGDNLSATVRVAGTDNAGFAGTGNRIEQSGSSSSAIVEIAGDGNAFEIVQRGGATGAANNDAVLDVVGDDNQVFLQQINGSGGAYFNTAAVSQIGDGHYAELSQSVDPRELSGGGLSATIDQQGDGHIARIQQSGADNTAALMQRGSANLGTIIQDGEGLSASLMQDGAGLDYIINQTGCVVGTGCGTVTVTQTGGP